MADDVKPEVIKRTQDLLGKYFKKPPLTEKLLRKPPFRFLHDIISAIIKETGFLDGLFTEEELNSENIKTKEAKLAYLMKLIDVVRLCTGINLTVRASKIVSGQEAAKTNELLQAIGKALDKKIDSAEVIEQYKRGSEKRKSPKDKASVKRDDKRLSSKHVSQTKIATAKDKSVERKKRSSNENNVSENDVQTRKDGNNETPKKTEVEKVQPSESPQEKVPLSAHRRRSSSSRHKESKPPTPSETTKTEQTEQKVDESKKQKEHENRSKLARSEQSESQNQMVDTNLQSKFITDTKDNRLSENVDKTELKEKDLTKYKNVPDNKEKAEQMRIEMGKLQSEDESRPRTSLRPPTSRPISARPAAPRLRGKPDITVNEEIMTPIGNISVIVESANLKDDGDAEDMVVMETKTGGNDSLENSGNYKVDDQLTQKHGHLVAQILETQKELVNNDNLDLIPKKTNISWDTSSKRDVIAKEVDKLRNCIQTLTRATNPLGKLFNYFQEHVETMQKELVDWRNQYKDVNEQLKIEKKKTQELIEPMKETLREIEHNMKDQLNKICQAKAQIMKNDQRIQMLLSGNV